MKKKELTGRVPLELLAAGARVYREPQHGRVLFVCDGISDGETFATYWCTDRGSLRRFKSPRLPLRRTRAEAQQDLDRYAADRGLGPVPLTTEHCSRQGVKRRGER